MSAELREYDNAEMRREWVRTGYPTVHQCPLCKCHKSGYRDEPNHRDEWCTDPLPDRPYCVCHDWDAT